MNRATPIDDKSSQIVQFYLRNHTEETKAANAIAFDRQVTLIMFVAGLKVSYCSF